ncbi:MAG: FAD-dependent oxidoreductase, partial [Patescibacteria group bacterium]
ELGYTAKTDWVEHLVELDSRKQIKIDLDCATSRPGVFAAGDVTNIKYKQVVISAGEGAKAALSVAKYLQEKGLVKRAANTDWGLAKANKKEAS